MNGTTLISIDGCNVTRAAYPGIDLTFNGYALGALTGGVVDIDTHGRAQNASALYRQGEISILADGLPDDLVITSTPTGFHIR